ncbi:MAG: hypothetical protein ACREBB_08845 [Nitrosotalea sp.]
MNVSHFIGVTSILVYGIFFDVTRKGDLFMRCKGICDRFAAKKPYGGFRFLAGQRPCSVCGIFIDISLNPLHRCPCCNNKLRLSSRNAKSRKNRLNIFQKSLANLMTRQEDKTGIAPTLK